MTEAKMTPTVMKYLAKNWKYVESAGIEVKLVKHPMKSLPYNAIASHQSRSLRMCEKRFLWKIPDLGNQNPFDIMLINEGMGVLAVVWYIPRKQKRLTLIFIHDLIDHKKTSVRKSLTLPEAEQIAFEVVDL